MILKNLLEKQTELMLKAENLGMPAEEVFQKFQSSLDDHREMHGSLRNHSGQNYNQLMQQRIDQAEKDALNFIASYNR